MTSRLLILGILGAAKVAEQCGVEVILLGTPAEEGGGGKIKMVEAGVFEGVAAAMMFLFLWPAVVANCYSAPQAKYRRIYAGVATAMPALALAQTVHGHATIEF